ncbi:MAG: hypothetical protein E7645_01390 [Ruminococcaceae bacterium]|nr:hypothetical protein [Oscillospiraceae bacterium]
MKYSKLRLLSVLLLTLVLLVGIVACTGGQETETTPPETDLPTENAATSAPSDEATEDIFSDPTEVPTEIPTEAPTEEETLRELTWETYDPALDNSTVDKNAEHIVDATQWVATDGLGRLLPINTTTGDMRNKTVAIFYWTWHGDFADTQYAYNNQKNLDIMADLGMSEEEYFTKSAYELKKLGIYTANASDAKYHFWDEPVFGYYDGDDEWVIRKHAEMLAAAGVDVVFFDNTNGTFTWKDTAIKVMKVFSEARQQGVDAPYVSFMFPFGPVEHAGVQMVQLYNEIYSKDLYKDVWYMLDGKPMVMGWPGSLNSQSAEIKNKLLNFFTFRSNLGGYQDKESTANQWGWLSRYPQSFFHNEDKVIEQITVGVAINHNYVDSVIAPMNGKNIIDRTWTDKGYDTREDALFYGACFAEQWNNAISVDPEIVFVTAWNEWVAMKLQHWTGDYYNCFVDQYDALRSRDTEPSNGILKDHYYYQLISFIRQFKGTNPIEQASPEKLMDVNGGYGQWADVGPAYNDYFGMTIRDFDGYRDPTTNKRLHYYNDTGRNDIYDAKVARDYENIYFMVRTVDDLTPYTDADWMRLYINVDDEYKGWEGYDFVLNKTSPTATEATLEKFTGFMYKTEVVGTVSYSVQGNVMMVCIPKTLLGIPADTYKFSLDFKWVDNANEDELGDIMLWYSNGDVAPIGRFNYCYTTAGSAPHDGKDAVLGWEVLDLTDAEIQETLKASLVGPKVEGFDVSFGEDGMTLTSTKSGDQAELILDYTLSNPRLVADNFEYVTITYKTTDLAQLRLGYGSGDKVPVSTNSRAKVMDLVKDGEVNTVTLKIGGSRGWENYVHQLGIYFPKGKAAGATITIMSIELHEQNPNPEAE